DAAAVESAATTLEQTFGPIDVWINNAMLSVFSPVKEMSAEEYRRVTEVTYLGYVHGSLSALRRMLPRDRGIIIQVGSALAYRGIPLQSAYCAAKHAIQGFCDSLRCELIHDGSNVRLTMVQMPAMNTPQFGWVKSRLPRKGQPVPPIFQLLKLRFFDVCGLKGGGLPPFCGFGQNSGEEADHSPTAEEGASRADHAGCTPTVQVVSQARLPEAASPTVGSSLRDRLPHAFGQDV